MLQILGLNMNKIIKEQLENIDIPYTQNENIYFFKKYEKLTFKLNHLYLIKLNENIYNNSILMSNWNNNNIPTSNYMTAFVDNMMNDKIHVDAFYYNINDKELSQESWQGWLTIGQVEILNQIK